MKMFNRCLLSYFRYSVLPYWNQEHDDALALLEREMARAAAAEGDNIVLNDQKDDEMQDPDEGDESQNDSDPIAVDYMEGAEVPDKQKTLTSNPNKNLGEEVLPSNLVYSQPHRIQKLPSELGQGQMDNFENPYRRQKQNNVNPPNQQNTYATGKVFFYFSILYFYNTVIDLEGNSIDFAMLY